MANTPLLVTVGGVDYGGFMVSLRDVKAPSLLGLETSLGGHVLPVAQVDAATGRVMGQHQWGLTFWGYSPRVQAARSSQAQQSLLDGWFNQQARLTLRGPNLVGLYGEPLLRWTSSLDGLVHYVGSRPWWSTAVAPVVTINGAVVASDGPAVNTTWGWLTFDSDDDPGSSAVVQVTVPRMPQVTIVGIEPQPYSQQRTPQSYDLQVTLLECDPS
jgi:hypothetical protein